LVGALGRNKGVIETPLCRPCNIGVLDNNCSWRWAGDRTMKEVHILTWYRTWFQAALVVEAARNKIAWCCT